MAIFCPPAKCHIISLIRQVPLIENALYAIDLDDTIFKSEYNSRYGTFNTVHRDILDIDFINEAAKIAKIIYITTRLASTQELTLYQLNYYGLPSGKLHMCSNKGLVLKEYIAHTKIIFIDDLHENVVDVQKHVPHAQCYRVDKFLYEKLHKRYNQTVKYLETCQDYY